MTTFRRNISPFWPGIRVFFENFGLLPLFFTWRGQNFVFGRDACNAYLYILLRS